MPDLPPLTRQLGGRFEHTRVFYGTDGEQAWLETGCGAFQEEVVAFAAAAGKHHFGWVGIDGCGDLLARFVNGLTGSPAVFVATRRIAVLAFQPGQHGSQHRGIKRCRGIVVEVNGAKHDRDQATAVDLWPVHPRDCVPRRLSSMTEVPLPHFCFSRWTRSARVTEAR